MIKNIALTDLNHNSNLQNRFLNVKFKNSDFKCNIYKGNFLLDTFNYFIINDEYQVFEDLFTRDNFQNNKHYYTNDFFINLKKNRTKFKEFKNLFVLGSNTASNYYSNLTQFLPRIFFISNSDIKIAINRNSSTQFREFIKLILNSKKIKFSFVFLDDDFYSFNNCEIPQFIPLIQSISILRETLLPINKVSKNRKIYVTREDSTYRRIINEADIIPILRSKGYKVINPQLYSISEQIEIFAQADTVVAPHGSNLTNIVFCKPGTEIYEIGPEFKYDYEKSFENRYKNIAEINKLKYFRFLSDTVTVDEHSEIAKKYINNKILESSNYYKNLIFKVSDINKIQ